MSLTLNSPTVLHRVATTSRALALTVALAGCSFGTTSAGSGEASLRVAQAALNGGSPNIALQVAQNILARTPDDLPALLIRGDALTQLGQNDGAVRAFKDALRRDPASAHARLGLGRVRLTTDPAEAAGLFRDVLRVDPNNASALTDLGIALDLLGQHAEARAYYRRVLADNPANVAVQVNLALSLAMTGDSVDALRLIEPLANDRTAPSKIRHNYAAILTMAGQERKAAEVLKLDMSPQDVQQAMAGYRQGTALASVQPAPVPPPATASQSEKPLTIAAEARVPVAAPTVSTRPERTETIVVTQTSAPLTWTPETAPAFDAPVPATYAPKITTRTSANPRDSGVQLGAFNSEKAAQSEWRRLQKKLPSIMAGRQPAITTIERDGTTFWRLRTSGFPDQSTASGFCSEVRPAKARCMVFRV